ncbi:MAG: endonuclease MutS2 [Bacteroidetes bacterium]|nr:endonuclease MutS2 [Bacteroidota bacterium]
MLYPQNIEQKLGFDKIKSLLEEECVSSLGRSFIEKIRFSDKFDQIKKMIDQTAEFRLILQLENNFPNQNYLDVIPYLQRAAIPGTFLDEEQFFDIKLSLVTIQQILVFFRNKTEEQYPQLKKLAQAATPENKKDGWADLISRINGTIDERGKVKDNASRELLEIRRKLTVEQNNVKRALERIYRTAKNSGWIGEDMTIAVRNGRLVLPLLAEHKRKLSGFVHDETSSGHIAFVEPGEVLETNNEIRDLEIRERREVVRILEQLTDDIRPDLPEMQKSYQFLGLMDFIRAKARVAQKVNATSPLLVNETALDWSQAVHPLLFLSHQKAKKPVIPLRVSLESDQRILVVSGPNAGGKSVMLKTIGLLQYMLQCGLLVPVSPDAKMGIFSNLFIDIGDEQSIENDLSTYSSHLSNMREFLKNADAKTLFLIDEFGTGTEPTLGGAIAESILEQLLKSKAFGVVNTHYTNLKIFADKNEGLKNGAMKFDAEHLEPLYELEMGQPGSSFALEVAQKMGLPHWIINNAKKKLGKQQVNFEKLLKELEIEKKVFSEQNQQLQRESKELKTKIEQYNSLKNFLETDKKRLLNDAKENAKQLLKEANKKIESTIKEIKEHKADREKTKEIRKELEVFEKSTLKPERPAPAPKTTFEKASGAIEVGDFVKIVGQETFGQVVSLNGKDAEVSLGELKSNIKLNRLERVSKKEFKAVHKDKPRENLQGIDMNEKMQQFSFNLDVRGKRGEEAVLEVDMLMDDAIFLGYPQLRIVHGKGDGILRNLIRNHLKQYKSIKKMYDEHADRGGQGVTIVDMK